MKTLVITLFAFLSTLFQSRRSLQFEIVALRHQLNVYQRTVKRPRIGPGDRVLWSWFARRQQLPFCDGIVRLCIVWDSA